MATSDLTLLDTLLQDWRELLSLWAQNGTLTRAAQEALQLEGEPEKMRELVGEWSLGDFRNLPPVVVLPASAMPGAVGAYAISTGTIYLNQDWLASANKERVTGVLTEELGHHLDGLLNVNDTPGDEGELFSTLVLGENLQTENLALLGEENDNSTISLNQDKVLVELSSSFTHPAPGSNRTWSIDGALGGYEGHTGQDFAYTSASRPQIPWILASKSGKVIKSVSNINYNIPFVSGQKPPQNGYGNHIVIDHGDGYTTLYAHLNSISVTNGQSVAQGQIIGVMGNTGWSSKEHLHFEIRRVGDDGKLIFENPWPLINGSPPLPPIAPPPPTADSRLSLPIFDPAYYLATYADVRNAYGATNNDGAKSHWLEFGIKEGRRGSLVFDPKDYLQRYQDVANAYGATNYAGAISHWLEWGLKYGRRGSQEFDPIYYMAAHPDVEAAYGVMNFSGAISHYYQWGKPGGWYGSEWITDQNAFQLWYYINNNADVKAVTANANQEVEATRHWYFIGINEGRRGSAELDSKFYLANNPDVRAAYGDGNYRGAIDHYLLFGKPTGRAGANDTPRTLSISDASVSEGNTGARELSFVVSLNIVSGETVAVSLNTSNGTAGSGTDYSVTSGSLSFAPGETSKTVVVQIVGDTTHEGDETFYVNLSGASNAAITRSKGVGTILNDDPANNAPTALGISASGFNEAIAAGSIVATLTTSDPNAGNTFSYSLVSGSGDTDNNAFSISGNQLSIKASPDFETKPSYSVRLRSTDQGGLSIDRALSLTVNNLNEAPTALTLSTTTFNENIAAGSIVATLTTSDPDAGNTFSYSLVSGSGDTDNNAFSIGGNQLSIKASPDFETKPSYSVRLRSTDQGGLSIDRALSLTVNNLNEAPTAFTLSTTTFNEAIAAGSTIATLGTTDPDSGDTFSYALVTGTGSTDNAAFSIAANQLNINTSPNFESKSSYSIRIRSTDAAGLSFEKVVALNVNDLPEQVAPPQGSTNTPSTTGNNSPATSVSNGSGTTITNNINNSINITGSFNGNTSAQALAGSLKLEDPGTKQALPVNGDSAVKTLAQLTAAKPLSDTAKQLLDRYIIKDPSSSSSRKASADDAGFIDFTLKTGSLKSLTAEIALASEVKATAYVKVNPNTGDAYDFTYDPVTGLGAELLDTNKNGLVDSLRIHLQDGGLGDVDGAVNGSIRDPGVLAEAPRTPVYRFYRNGVHFYTTSDAERDNVIKQSYGSNTSYSDLSANPQAKDPITGGWGYKYEGVAYQALDTQGTALYRFFSPSKGYHFVTTNAKEALAVIQNSVGSSYDLSNAQGQKLLDKGWGFQFEGNTYKVSTIAQTGMDNPVYRFFNATKGVHFYSSSMVEAKSVITNSLGASYATDSWISSTSDAIKAGNSSTPAPLANGWGYSFEGIAWYV